MSKGMWCKQVKESCLVRSNYNMAQLTDSGDIFYYNSTLNKSVWKAPPDTIIFQAQNLKRPRDIQKLDVENFINDVINSDNPIPQSPISKTSAPSDTTSKKLNSAT